METGLLKLWRTTGKYAYLLLTQKLLDLRGDSTTHSLYLDYDNGKNPYFFQDYTPIQSFVGRNHYFTFLEGPVFV